MNTISSNFIQPAQISGSNTGVAAAGKGKPETSFKEFMLDQIQQVQQMQQQADLAIEQFSTGGNVNAAEVLTAVQKADMTFRMMMQIRNKLIQAYQELKEVRI